MGSDGLLALGPATLGGVTLFGHTVARPASQEQAVQLLSARTHALDDVVMTRFVELPQVRHTFRVLGSRPVGSWGLDHGVNEHRLAVGRVALSRHRVRSEKPGILGGELVRLVLERASTASQALQVLAELIERHGQSVPEGAVADDDRDQGFVIADPTEAFVVETAGQNWVQQEVRQVRAVSNVTTIRQDWDKISTGLADRAIEQGWWPNDGSKLDFADAFAAEPIGAESGLRRWGRATFLLEQQNGQVDLACFRRVFRDHYEGTPAAVDPWRPTGPRSLCRHAREPEGCATTASFLVELGATTGGRPGLPVLAWCAFGPPCLSVYLPVLLVGEVPQAYLFAGADGQVGNLARQLCQVHDNLCGQLTRLPATLDQFQRLQAVLDERVEEFLQQLDSGDDLRDERTAYDVARRATELMGGAARDFATLLARLPAGTSFAVAAHAEPRGSVGTAARLDDAVVPNSF